MLLRRSYKWGNILPPVSCWERFRPFRVGIAGSIFRHCSIRSPCSNDTYPLRPLSLGVGGVLGLSSYLFYWGVVDELAQRLGRILEQLCLEQRDDL